MKLGFRQKIFFTYLVIFLLFLVLLFPYAARSVRGIVRDVLEKRTSQMIESISETSSIQGMISNLKKQKSLIFFRVTLLSSDGRILYESHADRSALPLYKSHPEIEDALEKGTGYYEDYSYHFGEQFAYIAESFSFQGHTYILRTAFPFNQIKALTHDFQIVFLKFGIGILALFSVLTWMIMNHLTRPIHQIIETIKPYQSGKAQKLPIIQLEEQRGIKDFQQLAYTLNSLSTRIESQIETLTRERNERATVLNSLVEGIISVDQNNEITYINDVALDMFSANREDLLNQPFTTLKNPKCESLLSRCQRDKTTLSDTLDLYKNKKSLLEFGPITKNIYFIKID